METLPEDETLESIKQEAARLKGRHKDEFDEEKRRREVFKDLCRRLMR